MARLAIETTPYGVLSSSTTNSESESRPRSLKRIDSFSYEDQSQPLPEIRAFKITDFIVGKKMGKGQFG